MTSRPTSADGPPDHLKTGDVSYFDPRSPGRGVYLPLIQMNEAQFEMWREDYYAGLIVPNVFGVDPDGIPLAPHGMSVHGVPKLHPDDQ